MRNLIGLVFILMLCPTVSFASVSYHYDATTGKCLNANGQEGLNHPDVATVLRYDQNSGMDSGEPTISNKDLECADLSAVNFRDTLKSGASYVHLVHWNLKGARLSQSDMKWMVFVGGNIAGVDLTKSSIGYTMFQSVQIDSFTQGLSEFCISSAEQGLIHCQM